ncbi:fumarylacetoacetate hydrolase [Lutibacter oricola]|uniref:fumarylacetoacetase n=1 Tax=Lutibacter oricola TaxID=762486 RepID=A0A1H2XKK5_9FLAO|nr:fumarylacetoacetase [Lutibacter oricola]SDW93266.1 fumarylacetoacetate hydrolase [Lutibacter oricola]
MKIKANNPELKSWLDVDKQSDFPIQNIPFGVFITKDDIITIGTRIGEYAIDLGAFHQLGYFDDVPLTDDMFMQDSLNDFIADGRKTWRLVRNKISEVFEINNSKLKDNAKHKEVIIFDVNEVEMLLPIDIGDFTDFISSKNHAQNVAKMFNLKNGTLESNWHHMPLGFNERASSVVVSGTPIKRPYGQILPENATTPVFGASEKLDMEVETAFITTAANHFGEPIPVNEAEEYIFGLVLLNDWSSRDVQRWESKPLGPFSSKSFASTVSPWIVTLDALEPFRCESPKQETLLPYLQQENTKNTFNITLNTYLETENGDLNLISASNFKNIYWSMSQQLAHQTINGCNVRAGDLFGSGTISGANIESSGSLLELSWNGENPITLNDKTQRTFLNDGDNVILRGFCENEKVRIGFGKCTGKIKPAIDLK